MDAIALAAEMLQNKLGSEGDSLDMGTITNGLQGLLPTEDGELNLSQLMSQFSGGDGIASILTGGESGVSPDSILSMFGESKLAEFASTLGIDVGSAIEGLSAMLPELLENVGGTDGGDMLSMGQDALKKLF
jgi:uncharacterized protein YidB (DUF937 family)